MFVTTAIIGASFKKDPSLSSDSTTRMLLLPTRAFEPCNPATLPPTTTVGSISAALRMAATIEVVRLSVTARYRDAKLQPHQLSQQLSPRNHRNLLPSCFRNFRIRTVERRRHHHRLRASNVLCTVPCINLRAEFL